MEPRKQSCLLLVPLTALGTIRSKPSLLGRLAKPLPWKMSGYVCIRLDFWERYLYLSVLSTTAWINLNNKARYDSEFKGLWFDSCSRDFSWCGVQSRLATWKERKPTEQFDCRPWDLSYPPKLLAGRKISKRASKEGMNSSTGLHPSLGISPRGHSSLKALKIVPPRMEYFNPIPRRRPSCVLLVLEIFEAFAVSFIYILLILRSRGAEATSLEHLRYDIG